MDVDLPLTAAVDDCLCARRWQLRTKRVFDAIAAMVLLAALSPLLGLIAICIRLESRGPALFSQLRWGLGSRTFTCYKFRSMRVNATRPGGATAEARDGHLVKMPNDPRVTRIGGLLRRTSVDELPQLWNVVKGDMSFVGPRPLVIHMLDPYPEIRAVRCKVRPGITGLWQIHERQNNTHVSAMLAYDIQYLRTMSLFLDASILAQTIRVVIRGNGAV